MRERGDGVVGGEEEERDEQGGERGGVGEGEDAFCFVLGGKELVVEEAMDEMAD